MSNPAVGAEALEFPCRLPGPGLPLPALQEQRLRSTGHHLDYDSDQIAARSDFGYATARLVWRLPKAPQVKSFFPRLTANF
jgi:hypothetical protein